MSGVLDLVRLDLDEPRNMTIVNERIYKLVYNSSFSYLAAMKAPMMVRMTNQKAKFKNDS